MHLNTLDYEQWNGVTSAERWQDTDHEGWKGLRAMRAVKGENREFTDMPRVDAYGAAGQKGPHACAACVYAWGFMRGIRRGHVCGYE